MGKRKKRRKRRRAEERAEQALSGDVDGADDEEEYEDEDDDEEEEESPSLASRFGLGNFRQSQPAKTEAQPQYDDKPWWSKEEDFELSDYEREQYGDYQKMPPPLEPEHLRQPEVKKPESTPAPSPIGQVATVTTQEVGKVVERVKKIDWELVMVQVSEVLDKIKRVFQRIFEEIQFRNLQMRETVPPKYHLPIYATIAAVLIGIPLVLVLLTLTGGDNPDVQVTTAPQSVVVQPTDEPIVQPTFTPQPEVVLPTDEPIVQSTDIPIPATAIPTNPPQTTDIPVIQPTDVPIVTGSIAPFFAPPVQYWAGDIQRWAQTYGVDASFMAMIMQLETCGNPLHLGGEGRMGIFAVPGDRFQPEESFLNPEDNARRASELIQQCYALTNNDIGQAYACYRSNTDTTQVSSAQWSESMQRYFLWGLGVYGDALANAQTSAALNDWLVSGGGFDVCNAAQSTLDGQ